MFDDTFLSSLDIVSKRILIDWLVGKVIKTYMTNRRLIKRYNTDVIKFGCVFSRVLPYFFSRIPLRLSAQLFRKILPALPTKWSLQSSSQTTSISFYCWNKKFHHLSFAGHFGRSPLRDRRGCRRLRRDSRHWLFHPLRDSHHETLPYLSATPPRTGHPKSPRDASVDWNMLLSWLRTAARADHGGWTWHSKEESKKNACKPCSKCRKDKDLECPHWTRSTQCPTGSEGVVAAAQSDGPVAGLCGTQESPWNAAVTGRSLAVPIV